MCGRFYVDDEMARELEKICRNIDQNPLVYQSRPGESNIGNKKNQRGQKGIDDQKDATKDNSDNWKNPSARDIHPTESALILIENKESKSKDGKSFRTIVGEDSLQRKVCKWGYSFSAEKKPVINARSESVMEKSLFQYDFEYHRCVIPARGFYEWNQKKEKYTFQYQNQKEENTAPIMYFAGIYHRQPGLDTFAIITREALDEAAVIHDRMPLMIKEKDIARWLSSRKDAMELLMRTPYDKNLRIYKEETQAESYQIELNF